MIRKLIVYPVRFILLVLVQVIVLNNVQFSSFINPFLYILFILWLPVEMNKALVMLLGFLIGLSVDVFSDTLGMHTSATVFLAFVRPYVLRFLAPRDGYELSQAPSISELGLSWFVLYVSICTLLHHLFLFFVEVYRFVDVFNTVGRAFASGLFTILLILITQYFHHNAEAKR